MSSCSRGVCGLGRLRAGEPATRQPQCVCGGGGVCVGGYLPLRECLPRPVRQTVAGCSRRGLSGLIEPRVGVCALVIKKIW